MTPKFEQRLNISLNCVGTEHYDPRPAVIAFLEKKERRSKLLGGGYMRKRTFHIICIGKTKTRTRQNYSKSVDVLYGYPPTVLPQQNI